MHFLPAILQLLAREDQPLLVGGNALLVLDLGLHILDGVGGLHLEGDGLTRQGLHEDLHVEASRVWIAKYNFLSER